MKQTTPAQGAMLKQLGRLGPMVQPLRVAKHAASAVPGRAHAVSDIQRIHARQQQAALTFAGEARVEVCVAAKGRSARLKRLPCWLLAR